YGQWVDASQRLQAVCLKTNLEAARRSRLSGYSHWLFQDYPNCAEGVVDMFFRSKALGAADFRKFNAPTVLLLDAPRRTFHVGETARVTLLASRFEDQPTAKAVLRWELRAGKEVVAAGSRRNVRVTAEGVQEPAQRDGHSGILLQKDHPALRAMAAESWCDLQFFTLLEGSKIVLLDEVPAKVRPIVRCIDMPQRFLEKAYLFEVSVGKGKLLTSGL